MVVFEITDSMTGVYVIKCKSSGRVYVGSTIQSFKTRWHLHRVMLRENRHHSITLQRSWNKYGESDFTFSVCEVTEPNYAVAIEQVYMDYYQSYIAEKRFNIAPVAGSSKGVKHSDETKMKVSRAGKGKLKSDKTKRNMSLAWFNRTDKSECADRMKALNASRIGVPLTPEHRLKISLGGKGIKRSEETKQKQRKPRTDEQKRRISQGALIRNQNPEYIQKLRDAANRNAAAKKGATDAR